MQTVADRSEAPNAIRTDLGAIFVSLELSRSRWLITSLSPDGGEKMSKHAVRGGDVARLLERFAQLRKKALARTGKVFPFVVIQEAGLDGFWIDRVLRKEGIEGFGELPDTIGWARPLAVTGQVGYQIPTTSFDVGQGTFIPQVLVYGGSLQYSMPYLKTQVKDLGLPDLINHLIPLVEVQFATPVANNLGNSFVTTGTINPGVIWVGSYYQVGFEAIIPVNRDSGTGVGFLGQFHLYLDDIFPKTYGQPLIGGTGAEPKMLTF